MNSQKMNIVFSDAPGCRERHLLRKYLNPHFFKASSDITQQAVDEAREADVGDFESFQHDFRDLLEEVSDMEGRVDTEHILGIKERIDQLYDRCMNLGESPPELKNALLRLNDSIMKTIRQAAGADTMATRELDREEQARQLHLELVEYKLVSDLLRSDSPIEENELVPTLLSEDPESVQVVMSLFDPEQQDAIRKEAGSIISILQSRGEVPGSTQQAFAAMNQHKQ